MRGTEVPSLNVPQLACKWLRTKRGTPTIHLSPCFSTLKVTIEVTSLCFPFSILVTLISQPSLPLSFSTFTLSHSSAGCPQHIDRHGTQHKHEKSKAARASTPCATWPRTLSSNSGASHASFFNPTPLLPLFTQRTLLYPTIPKLSDSQDRPRSQR